MAVRGVETVSLSDISVGDIVLLGSVGRRDVQAIKVDSVEEQRDRNASWLLTGPMIGLPRVGKYSFEGAESSGIYTTGAVTRLVPSEHVDAYLCHLQEQWGDRLTFQVGGADDVSLALLVSERGAGLREVIPPDADLIEGSPGALRVLRQLPSDGWRVVSSGDFSQPGVGHSVVVAAEDPALPGAWLTVSLTRHRAGSWACHTQSDSSAPVPSKTARRSGLKLSCPAQEPVLAGSSVANLELTITNTSRHQWVNTAGDNDLCVAWLRDDRGNKLVGSGYRSSFSSLVYLPRLLPGESASISNVTLLTPSLGDLPRGDYRLEARLSSLELVAEAGVLAIV